jgi:hypothetical protein
MPGLSFHGSHYRDTLSPLCQNLPVFSLFVPSVACRRRFSAKNIRHGYLFLLCYSLQARFLPVNDATSVKFLRSAKIKISIGAASLDAKPALPSAQVLGAKAPATCGYGFNIITKISCFTDVTVPELPAREISPWPLFPAMVCGRNVVAG